MKTGGVLLFSKAKRKGMADLLSATTARIPPCHLEDLPLCLRHMRAFDEHAEHVAGCSSTFETTNGDGVIVNVDLVRVVDRDVVDNILREQHFQRSGTTYSGCEVLIPRRFRASD
jgi:hypothetical protein